MSLKLIVSPPDPSYSFPLFYFIILFDGIRGAVRTTSCTIMPLWVGLCCAQQRYVHLRRMWKLVTMSLRLRVAECETQKKSDEGDELYFTCCQRCDKEILTRHSLLQPALNCKAGEQVKRRALKEVGSIGQYCKPYVLWDLNSTREQSKKL